MSKSVNLASSVFRTDIFSNKCSIVTGGSKGIGKAIAIELASLGSKVVIASRNSKEIQESAESIKSITGNEHIYGIECDIRKEESVKNLVKSSIDKLGGINFLVNNAGGQFPCPVENMTIKGWKAVIENNLHGPFIMCKEVFDSYMKENGGSIVNILAEFKRGFPLMAHTGAARSGMDNLTKTLSMEWASYGIRVNAVIPGTIVHKSMIKHYGEKFTSVLDILRKKIPVQRYGTCEEVSGAVCFLLSDAASFMTGGSIIVDGGQTLITPTSLFNVPEHSKLPAFQWLNNVKSKI
ncbi:DgyrCDS7515 [Dimorphilus gyrociliatus]|uniref:Peroxisomal trans-2-enoyl-CoA reductase n=1 Tax=Dimorphilus gyrociliatus TaxID=2664684 RepID=A0A7I8VR85_9ANNE|nr:DgyrCDS7515 [Dimorphilus gyrociliatus]